MAGTWERRGTVTVTQDRNVVIGAGTYWTDAQNGPQVGNTFYGPDGQAHEVAVIRSATELWLADEYKGATAAGVAYQIDTTRVDSVPGLASRVAAVLGFAQGQYDNLDKWTQGGIDEDVTLTSPNGETVTVPSLPRMGKDYAAVGDALPAAIRAEAAAADVSTKHDEVVVLAAQVSADAASAQNAKNTAVAAADTATQKAESAAIHDASSQDAATRAENAASAIVGAVLDGGECDLSTGVYPQPVTIAGEKYPTIWYVAVAGSVSGVVFDVGDVLRYTTAKTGYYFKVDAKDDVYSVNGEKGAVTVTPEKIGAEKTGVAQQLVDQHASKIGAHPVSGIAGLAALIDQISPPMGCSEWDRLRTSVRAGHVPSDGQILQRVDFPDMWAAIAAGKVPVVSDADWLADPYKRGSFSYGNGTSTFRVPDENGKFTGSIAALFHRGDGLKSAGTNGMIQGDAIREIEGVLNLQSPGVTGNHIGGSSYGGAFAPSTVSGDTLKATTVALVSNQQTGATFKASRVVPTGDDNRPASVTGCWVVKVIKSSVLAGLN